MKVLMLSTDGNIFVEGSKVRQRMIDYGSLVEELYIIVKSQIPNLKSQKFGNVFIYPANNLIETFKIGKKIIKKNEQWLITAQDPFETGLVGYLLKIKFRLPLQLQIHTDFLSPFFRDESLKNRFRVLLAKWLVKKADGIRVVSERIRNSLCSKLQVSSSKISVLPIFVDIEKIKNVSVRINLRQKYPGKFIILMASRLTREKNIGLAIGAMESVVKNNPKTLLLIVGDGPELEGLKLQVTSYKLQDSVIFEPWTNDLLSYYKTADLFLLTSNYEGYGRTVIEATAANLPVLMTDVGVAVGSVVPVGDREALTGRLELLIEGRLGREKTLESQNNILGFYRSKEDYLNRIKQSWENCFL